MIFVLFYLYVYNICKYLLKDHNFSGVQSTFLGYHFCQQLGYDLCSWPLAFSSNKYHQAIEIQPLLMITMAPCGCASCSPHKSALHKGRQFSRYYSGSSGIDYET
ncbi:hypothetical protein QE152_g25298 [Popillia japonica]|uniref:Uncharacterized protein n=1 Tax=Popillia japonica TaxID=7064 RepID=A0AAW1K252_POPJA